MKIRSRSKGSQMHHRSAVGDFDPERPGIQKYNEEPDEEDFEGRPMNKLTVSSVQAASTDELGSVIDDFNKEHWYDGTVGSIYDRSQVALALSRKVASALSGHLTDSEFQGLHEAKMVIAEEIESLKAAAEEIETADYAEYLDNLPGGTIARDYGNLIEGGVVDLGADNGSFLFAAAKEVQDEARNYDWDRFASEGADLWVESKKTDSPEMLRFEVATRKAAVDYSRDKTMVLMDAEKRANIINSFVQNAEKARRTASKEIVKEESRKRTASLHGNKASDEAMEILESNPDSLWW